MAAVDDLPADQRAVLQMLLQRGGTYEEIANLLSIERSAVRRRALDACDTLTADGIEPGPERALVTDYLLSQISAQVAEQVYIYLEGAQDDREWAAAVAERLEPLASQPLPRIPFAAPLRSDQPAAADEPHVLDDGRAPGSRRRRHTVLAGLSVAAAIVAVGTVVLVANSGSSAPKPRRTSSGPELLTALNLSSPAGDNQTLGVAQVVRDDGVVGIVIDAQDVPANGAHNAYGVWLYNSASSHRFVGFDPNLVGKNGKLAIEGTLPAGASQYKRLLITLETRQHPTSPGAVVLSGPFRER
jgi:hypothetical protein